MRDSVLKTTGRISKVNLSLLDASGFVFRELVGRFLFSHLCGAPPQLVGSVLILLAPSLTLLGAARALLLSQAPGKKGGWHIQVQSSHRSSCLLINHSRHGSSHHHLMLRVVTSTDTPVPYQGRASRAASRGAAVEFALLVVG